MNTHLTSGCYAEKLNSNLHVVLLVWLHLNVENIKRIESLVFADLCRPASVFDV